MTSESASIRSEALAHHLARFPEDLRDIRRLQRRFDLDATQAARAIESWLSSEALRGPAGAPWTH